MSGQEGTNWLLDALLVGRIGNGLIPRVRGTILASHGNDVLYGPPPRIIIGHCPGNGAVLVTNNQHPIRVTDRGPCGRPGNHGRNRCGHVLVRCGQSRGSRCCGGDADLENTRFPQPFLAPFGPGRGWLSRGAHTKAMAPRGVDVQFGGHACPFQGQVHADTVLRADSIIATVDEETWRRLGIDADLRRQAAVLLRQVRRVEKNGKVGTARDYVNVVQRFVLPPIPVGGRRSRKVPARREAQDADAVDGNLPLSSVRPYKADRSLGIHEGLHRWLVLGCPFPAWNTVLQHRGRYPDGIEPAGHLFPFVIPGEVCVAAAREYQDRHARVLRGLGAANRERRLRHVGQAGDDGRAVRLGYRLGLFFADRADLAGRLPWPDVEGGSRSVGRAQGRVAENQGQSETCRWKSHSCVILIKTAFAVRPHLTPLVGQRRLSWPPCCAKLTDIVTGSI